MKKLLLMASAICMGLLSSINVANAAHSGQSACAFDSYLVRKAGFVSGSYYDSATLRQLLSRLYVTPSACANIASCQYRYVCSEYHYLANNKLVPNQGPAIYWSTSQPF
jgi:hypothetical protein